MSDLKYCEHDYPINSNCPFCENEYFQKKISELEKENKRLQEIIDKIGDNVDISMFL